MFTIPFWVSLACGLAVSLAVSIAYGRHAIHPRLRPHFGQVLILFLLMAVVAFFLSLLIARVVGVPPSAPKPGLEGTPPQGPAKLRHPAPAPAPNP